MINLSSVFSSLYRYLVVSLGFIPIYFVTKLLFSVHSYEITLSMLLMVCTVIAICGIYYLVALIILKDSTINYAINMVKGKIKKS